MFIAKGASVFMLNRNMEQLNAGAVALKQEFGADAEINSVQMCLAILDSVRAATDQITQTFAKIDALICNIAVAYMPACEMTKICSVSEQKTGFTWNI